MSYICNSCKRQSSNWTGQCFHCNQWGTVVEHIEMKQPKGLSTPITGQALQVVKLDDVKSFKVERIKTEVNEFNRVLGGGLVPGAVILIGGEPGIGKSTLLLQVFSSIKFHKTLYVTAEESVDQVQLNAQRLNINNGNFLLTSGIKVEDIVATIKENSNIKVLVVDSIQTVSTDRVEGMIGAAGQIRGVSQFLIDLAKTTHLTIVIVGHITKDGNIAGPKLLEHMVDTVLYFESDIQNQFRILRAIKHRHGSINEIGVFEMTQDGLNEIANPSEYFLTDSRLDDIMGIGIFAGVEGNRPILVEFQVLLACSNMPMPRRSVVGWDMNRLAMIIAVLSSKLGMIFSNQEVYLSIMGGIKIIEPAADLAVAIALISALKKKTISSSILFFGEISLSGDIRRARGVEIRIAEAVKMGFKTVVCCCDDSVVQYYADQIKIYNMNKLQNVIRLLF